MSVWNNITLFIRSHIKFINIEMQIEKKSKSISQVAFLSAKSVCLTYG